MIDTRVLNSCLPKPQFTRILQLLLHSKEPDFKPIPVVDQLPYIHHDQNLWLPKLIKRFGLLLALLAIIITVITTTTTKTGQVMIDRNLLILVLFLGLQKVFHYVHLDLEVHLMASYHLLLVVVGLVWCLHLW